MTDRLEVLKASADRLSSLVGGLSSEQLATQSYASKWTIADVLSHIGSGAVIMRNGVDAAVSQQPLDPGFNQSVWDEWNAKPPSAQAADALTADQALLDRLMAVSADERAAFRYAMGPMQIDFDTLVGMRLNEHVLHSWDIAVALRPDETLPSDATAVVIDNLEMISRWASKSDGHERTITVRTTNPERRFAVTVDAERAPLTPAPQQAAADVELPAEALIRVVYGRLDPAHTPSGVDQTSSLDQLRRLFPGF
ncbi:MAG TPA: maleylpyruvate isomerase family mycothiol-dependent enzyme [Ilumatobacteraceae bacterium]